MEQQDVFNQMANISKAHAYDILREQVGELKEENERLKKGEFLLLLNEGTEDETTTTFGKYVRAMGEAEKDVLDEILSIGHFAVGESKQIGLDHVKRIN